MRVSIGVMSLVVVACVQSPLQDNRFIRSPANHATLNEVFLLAVGESASLAGTDVTITFRAVANDSRCPRAVECFAAGSALIELELDRGGQTTVLHLSDLVTVWTDTVRWSPLAFAAGYAVEVRRLTPYPDDPGVPIPEDEYRVAIEVSALPALAGVPVPISSLGSFCCSGLDTAGLVVVRDATAWRTMWERVYSGMQPPPSLPVVDFARSMVVIVAVGSRPTAGYDVNIAAAARDGRVVHIQALERHPGGGCVAAAMITNPIDIAALPAFDAAVDLSVVRRAHDCGGGDLP